jgi:hypothetical protein
VRQPISCAWHNLNSGTAAQKKMSKNFYKTIGFTVGSVYIDWRGGNILHPFRVLVGTNSSFLIATEDQSNDCEFVRPHSFI